MPKALLALAFLFCVPPSALQAQPTSVRNLTDAGASADTARRVFDGGLSAGAVAAPVRAGAAVHAPALKPAAPRADVPVPAVAPAGPFSPRPFSDGFVGLYPESDFELTTGRRCATCNAPKEGTWYFEDDVIAVQKTGTPSLVWIGSTQMLEHVVLSADGRSIRLPDGSTLPFALTPKIAPNLSYYNDKSVAFFAGRPLRVRGELVEKDGVFTFVARTIWPEDQRIDFATMPKIDVRTSAGVDALVTRNDGGAQAPFSATLLWSQGGSRDFGGKAVMGFMLNGAQGDDDEANAGHFSMFTGRMGPSGEMADWMFDNFYDMDQYSEKGIIASMIPMDKYMADLNSGQSYYRGTQMAVAVLKDPGLAVRIQEQFRTRYQQYYDHSVKYDRTFNPCTALVVDVLRADGWQYPTEGPSSLPSKIALSTLVGVGAMDRAKASQMWDIMSQDKSRLFPRAGFDSITGDLLGLVGAGPAPKRPLSPFEKEIQNDVEAVIFVNLPQIPSSRAFGRYPVASTEEYFHRVPLQHSKWKLNPFSQVRPFPPPH